MDGINSSKELLGFVSKCQFIPIGIKYLKLKQYSKYFIAVWNSNVVVIFGFDDQKPCFYDQKIVEKEELKFSRPIIDVFMTNNCIYAVDISGVVYGIHYKVRQVGEDKNRLSNDLDMFELSPECQHVWTQEKLGIVQHCNTLVTIFGLKNRIIAVTVYSGKLLGHVYKLNLFQLVFVVSLVEASVDRVALSCIDIPLSNELRNHYFSFLTAADSEVPLIGLSNGQALSFSFSNQPDSANVIFSSLQPIVNIEYVSDKHKQKCTSILVLVSSGSLIVLSGKSSQTLYATGPIRFSLFNCGQSALVTSDGISCTIKKLMFENSLQESNFKCTLKGVRALCSVPDDGDLVLVATQHCCIYWLDLSAVKVGNASKFSVPEDEVMKELFVTAKCLNEAHFKMKRDDSVMRAVSLATRANFLIDYFTILAKFFSGRNCADDKLKLRIETECDFASFTQDLWSLSLTISYGNSSMVSYVLKLDKPFTKDHPLVVEFNCSPVIESELSCKMIARIDDNQPLLVVPLGMIVVDAGYFLSKVKDKAKLLKLFMEPCVKMKTSSDDFNYGDCNVLDKVDVTSTSETDCYVSDKKIVVYSMKLDTSVPVEKIFQIVFRDSSHRMSKNQWLGIADPNVCEVNALIGQKYWVELNLDKKLLLLHIKSNDIYACYLVKRAVSARLGCDNPIQLDSDIYIEAEGIRYRYELERLKEDWNLKKFQDIKNEFRSFIINKSSILKQ